jgi:hypothetical protein
MPSDIKSLLKKSRELIATAKITVSQSVEKIEDHDIAPLWAEHFPKYQSDVLSKALVIVLCKALQDNARHSIVYGDWSDKIHHVLVEFAIPKHQFTEVEKESHRLAPFRPL